MKIRLFLIVMIPAFLMTSTIGIYLIEYILTGNKDSAFASIFSSLWWTAVTFTTVGYGDMSPETVQGKIFTFFVMAAGLINFSIVVSMVTEKFQEFRSGRDRGLDSIKIKSHILICSDDPTWMKEILSQNQKYVKRDKVVLISPSDEHPLLATSYKKLKWISGNSFDLNVLRKAAAAKAKIAYVFFKDSSYALMTVLQLETLSNGRIVTQAQYVGREYRKYFEDVGCDHALDPYDLYVPMMLSAFHSQGAPAWINKVINRNHGHQIATKKTDSLHIGKTWLELIKTNKQNHGIMPLAVVINEVVLINPDASFEIPKDSLIMQLEPFEISEGSSVMQFDVTESSSKGDLEKNAINVMGMDEIGIDGHILISSDNQVFINRCLLEMSQRNQPEKIIVLSDTPLMEEIPDNLDVEWIEGDSNSENSFLEARSTEAKVALIDHTDDGQNLMAVLRLEQATDGEVFTIATYHKEDFDQQLFKVGCDFCLEPEELIAPILSQSALNPGLGTLIEEIISEEPTTQSLHVRQLSQEWEADSWLSTILNLIAQDADSNVLSTPSIMTMDNEEASIVVGQEIPITTGETLSGSNSNPFRSVTRQEIGVKLVVRPQINEGNAVKMYINQEVSSIFGPLGEMSTDLITNKRNIKTTVLVEDGETIVLGGLIDDNVQELVKKVPFLGDIPLLGRLFKTTSISRTKRNLMVFLRPTIVRDSNDVRAISNRKYNYFQAIENDLINSGKMVPDTTILKDLLESDELQ